VLLDALGIPRKPAPPSRLESRAFRTPFSRVTGQRWDPLFHQGDIFQFVRNANCDLPKLGEQADYFLTGFAAGRSDQADEETGVIQVRPTNLSEERELIFSRCVYIAAREVNERKADVLKRGEALFNNTNSQEQVGKTVYFDLEGVYFSSNHITRIATKGSLNAQYLYYVLNLYQRQNVFFKLCTNWNNQSGVGVDVLQRLLIPLPDTDRQKVIVTHLNKVRDEAHALRRQAASEFAATKRRIQGLILGEKSDE
jgi:hypothetical protein